MKLKQGQPVLKVYIAPEDDMTLDELHKCLRIAVAYSGMSQQDYLFKRLTGDAGFRKARESLQQSKKKEVIHER